MASPTQVVTQLIVDANGAKIGVAQYESAMQQVKKTAIETGEVTAGTFDKVAARLANSIAKTDPLFKAQMKLEQDLARQRKVNADSIKLGQIDEAQGNVLLQRIVNTHREYQANLNKTTQATNAHVNATKLQRYEMINLSRQIQDVGVSLVSGQSPFTVLVQQGTQIADIAASSGVSLTNMFKQAGSSVLSFLTPARLATATVLGIGAAAVMAAQQFASSQVEMQRALIGAGRRSASPGDINSIANNRSSPTGLSISETREAALEFAKAGQIHSRVIGDMIDTTKNFALVTGVSSREAAAALAKAFTSMGGIDDLNKQFGFLGASSRRAIENLLLAGKTTEAAALANRELAASLKDVEATQGSLAKGWTAIGNAISDVNSKVGEYIARAAGLTPKTKGDRATELEGQIGGLERQIEGGTFNNLIGDTTNLDRAKARAGELREQLGLIKDGLAIIGAQDALRKLSIDAQQAVDAINPLGAKIREVTGTIAQLKAAQAAGTAVPGQQQAIAQYEQINAQLKEQEAALGRIRAKYPQMSDAAAKQVEALKDQNAMIKAQQIGTEATTAAAIAYKNTMDATGDSIGASAVKVQTLANYMAQSGDYARSLVGHFEMMNDALNRFNAGLGQAIGQGESLASALSKAGSSISWQQGVAMAEAENAANTGSAFSPSVMKQSGAFSIASLNPDTGLYEGGITGRGDGAMAFAGMARAASQWIQQQNFRILSERTEQSYVADAYKSGGVDAALAAVQSHQNEWGGPFTGSPVTSVVSDKISAFDTLTQLKNSQTTDKTAQAGNLQSEISFLRGLPGSIEIDQKIADLTSSIESLISSTDSLTSVNSELLSPYYNQDPRTSHIGFRSQGMASGGEFTVPGGYSANDNMLGTIPLASGEIVSVRRPGQGGSKTIHITNNITIGAGANVDQFKRTMFQSTQNQARQLRDAS